METVVDLKDKHELFEYVEALLMLNGHFVMTPDQLVVKPYYADSRIAWDNHIVTVEGYGVVGFTDGPVEQ